MRVSRFVLFSMLWLVFSTGCASLVRVHVDRDLDADLSGVTSFAVEEAAPATGDPEFGPTARRAAREALASALARRGLAETDPSVAEVLVLARTERVEVRSEDSIEVRDEIDVVHRRTGLRTPIGTVPLGEERVVAPRSEVRGMPGGVRERRELIVDFRRAEGGALLWRGRTRLRGSGIDPETLREHIDAIVERFPSD